jgi:hypothetical protein
MSEYMASGHTTHERIVDCELVAPVVRQWSIELQYPLIDELEHDVSEDWLAERGGLKDGVGSNGLAMVLACDAEAPAPDRLPVAQQ